MTSIKKQQCIHCHIYFIPDHRNGKRQKFCHLTECRQASKAASQKRWLAKNPDYFKGACHVQRVQEWRRAHIGRHKGTVKKRVLQDSYPPESSPKQVDTIEVTPVEKGSLSVLQDSWIAQQAVLIGLIAQVTGLVLQDDIASVTCRLAQLGQDVLNGLTLTPGGPNDSQVSNLSRPHPHHSPEVQLAGSSPGP